MLPHQNPTILLGQFHPIFLGQFILGQFLSIN
uniref:Uncharacterized protein n=1 Tax=Medicago truncatula TaxID=3880 RepID=I3SCJ0_MEDTR|nr:unknown [Medicago truncatula]